MTVDYHLAELELVVDLDVRVLHRIVLEPSVLILGLRVESGGLGFKFEGLGLGLEALQGMVWGWDSNLAFRFQGRGSRV